ncbi:hypothetical protein GALMADRAFT_249670 [Galerina marginata CBS 339.88]|uniref:Uncharacterized protein n=1 Tax=Galerina marginata (strain CBS 339.88) TaxID=685588 RepID=A0A067SV11_GALM3|nr:hypothetical protein GALMADRAFT_249670 [Galerina marginata CBS 339.88]
MPTSGDIDVDAFPTTADSASTCVNTAGASTNAYVADPGDATLPPPPPPTSVCLMYPRLDRRVSIRPPTTLERDEWVFAQGIKGKGNRVARL